MKWVVRIFTALYVIALGLFLVGTFGWFGQEPDPMAGVFLMPLGMPWNLFFEGDDTFGFLVALMAPAINLGILWMVCDLVESRED
ncbi:hypothetical protein EKN06_12275 [Croceicoccus ponticola]|uniref:Uncharacterized protein n=1 Tax=Croceicoccus ponticola TaxID=2217664 RepID=A0A437GV85_9SPHN|nr:hypothetical protein [Croceicoccus ponticola]RVQ65705.1 hypothetical protein EKN06_12275 [Croceicoccus ponticola]